LCCITDTYRVSFTCLCCILDTYIVQEFRTLWSSSMANTFFSYITFSAVYLLMEHRTIIAGLGMFCASVSLTVACRLLPVCKTLHWFMKYYKNQTLVFIMCLVLQKIMKFLLTPDKNYIKLLSHCLVSTYSVFLWHWSSVR